MVMVVARWTLDVVCVGLYVLCFWSALEHFKVVWIHIRSF